MTAASEADPASTPEPIPPRLLFPRHFRLRSSLDFERIYEQKHKASDSILLIFAERNGLPHCRIGLSVSRRNGNSVVRHRLRRLLREAFRLEQHAIPPGLDLILIPGREVKSATQEDLRRSIVKLTKKLHERLAPLME